MRLLDKRQVKELVLYSYQHIARLEKAGQGHGTKPWQGQYGKRTPTVFANGTQVVPLWQHSIFI